MSKRMGIYMIYNVLANKYYVGSSVDIDRRLAGHFAKLRKGVHDNVHLQRAFNRDGEGAFVCGFLEEVEHRNDLTKAEQVWIDSIGDYNICKVAGNTLGWVPTEDTRAKMRAAQSGENNPMFGKKRPEIAELMSKVHKGRRLTEEHKAKMSAALKGNRGCWDDPEKAAKVREAARRGRTGKPHDAEARRKMSEKARGRKLTAEHKRKIAEKSALQRHSEETKKKIGDLKRGKKLGLSEEERQRRADQVRENAKNISFERRSEIARRAWETRRKNKANCTDS